MKEFPQKWRDVGKAHTLVPQFFQVGNARGISKGNVLKLQVQLNRIRAGVHIACCAEFLHPGARDSSFHPKRDGARRFDSTTVIRNIRLRAPLTGLTAIGMPITIPCHALRSFAIAP